MPLPSRSRTLVKVARAIERGTLHRVSISIGFGDRVHALLETSSRPGYRGARGASDPRMLAWFEKSFPGGRHRLVRSGGRRPTRRDRHPGLDSWEYIASDVLVVYSKTHEHRRLFCHVEAGVTAERALRWQCDSCSTMLTATEASTLGLPTRSKAAVG